MRHALRRLRKSPRFAAVAVLSLALGIGANTAIFSLFNEFLLRSLPVKNPLELVLFRAIHGARGSLSRSSEGHSQADAKTGRDSITSFSLLTFERFRAHHPALSAVFAFAPFGGLNVLVDGQPELDVSGQLVSGNYHAGLGVTALLGRTLTPDDDRPAAVPVAVISYRYWQNRFGGDPAVIGRTIQLNQVPTTIVGVTPSGFDGALQVGESPEISVPLALYARFRPDNPGRSQPWYWWVRIMGRLAPGATAAQARASLEPIFQAAAHEGWLVGQSLENSPGNSPDTPHLAVDPGAQGENETRRQHAKSLHLLLGLASLLLLAACANVANLLVARAAARRREFAVRLALGAGRARVVQQLFAESLLLAALGATLGTFLAYWGRDLLLALRPFGHATDVLDLPIDGRVLAFTIAVSVATALIFGLAPALRASRVDLSAEFQGGPRTLGAGDRSRFSQTLMVVQIAFSLVLLVSTGLFIRTLRNLQNVDPGFNRHHLVLFQIDPQPAGYSRETIPALQARLRTRLENLPGARRVTFSSQPLLSASRNSRGAYAQGIAPGSGSSNQTFYNLVAPNFFATLEIPLVLGRVFTDHDNATAPKVAVVNQTFARKHFGDENPIGRRFGFDDPRNSGDIEIVGVARDAKYAALRADIPATVYIPILQQPNGTAHFSIRTDAAPHTLFPAIRAAMRDIDPSLPALNLRTQDEQIDRLHAQELLFARLSGFFGALALVLACVGLYGLMSYAVLRRTGEIGLRMALGALPDQVLRMVLRESLALVTIGVALGVAVACAASHLIASMLFGLSPIDPLTYGTVALVLTVFGLAASLLPAWRATRINPLDALRSE